MNHRILIVEDDRITLSLLRYFLQKNGFDILETNNYDGAVALLNSVTVDVVLLDVFLPGDKSGLDVASYIARHPTLSRIHIIILSAHPVSEAGLYDILPPKNILLKPASPNVLLILIHELLGIS
ncbi:MAG: response regulator [Phototrophicaceae bacterium]